MKLRWAIAAVALQVLALVYLAGQRELILHTGQTVWLRTAPVDPRDAMRGDYVRLDYEISRVSRSLWRDGLANSNRVEEFSRGGRRVYASLRVNTEGLGELVSLSDRQPADGLFLRGSTESSWGDTLRVQYGIEAFFMEQGRAKEMENQIFTQRNGVPLNTQVAVSRRGVAVLKDYRWESLGLTVELETLRQTNNSRGFPQQQTLVTGAKVELKNHGPEPVAIVSLPAGQSFALVPDTRWGEVNYRWANETNASPAPRPEYVTVLKPGDSFHTRLDLTRPEWFVISTRDDSKASGPVPLKNLATDWSAHFRLEYRPPPAAACAGLPNGNLIYHGRVTSRGFNPGGIAD